MFISLHVHDQFSLLDSVAKTDDLIARAKELGMPALAITNHGNLFSHLKFYNACLKEKIKPIIGVEAYLCQDHLVQNAEEKFSHLTLLAQNQTGYQNLLKLVSISYQYGFYRKPRMDWKLLAQHGEGIICLTGCLNSELSKLIATENEIGIQEWLIRAKQIFADRLYLEITPVDVLHARKHVKKIFELSKKYSLPAVATSDVHYTTSPDCLLRNAVWAIQDKKTLRENTRKDETQKYYLMSEIEMCRALEEFHLTQKQIEQVMNESGKIADRCSVTIESSDYVIAQYGTTDAYENLSHLCEVAFWEKVGAQHHQTYRERMDYELSVVKNMNLANYFLVVQDVLRFCREHKILAGPGRGSAAGSLLCFLLGITKVDPIKYSLLFERFLNPGRADSFPDIDTDLAHQDRGKVIDYLKEKYGVDHVSNIVTFGTMGPKAALKDAGRVLEVPFEIINEITKLVPYKVEGSPTESLQLAIDDTPALQWKMKEFPELFHLALKLEDTPRQVSTHASAFLVTPQPILNYAPLYRDPKSKDLVCGIDMYDCEKLKILKFDFLGLKTLSVEEQALQLIEQRHGVQVNLDDLEFEDPRVWKMFCDAETVGTFQTETPGMQQLLRKIQPKSLYELSVVNSLDRPGPLNKGMDRLYANRKFGKQSIESIDPSIEEILKPTYQTLVFQEQVMQIAETFAGFSKTDADVLRKSMGKKKRDLVLKMKEQFLAGADHLGRNHTTAEHLFEIIEEFSEYAFNMSHSLAYSVTSYHTAWLKTYYPREFMCAILNVFKQDQEEIQKYLDEVQRLGLKVLPPDIQTSGVNFTITLDHEILYGLGAIRDVGEIAAEQIIAARPFKSMEDFVNRLEPNAKTMTALIRAGAFDLICPYRYSVEKYYDAIRNDKGRKKRKKIKQEECLFDVRELFQDTALSEFGKEDYPTAMRARLEWEYLGAYLTTHPVQALSQKVQGMKKDRIVDLLKNRIYLQNKEVYVHAVIREVKKTFTKAKKEPMAFIVLSDPTGKIEGIVFPQVFAQVELMLLPGTLVALSGKISGTHILVDEFSVLTPEADCGIVRE